MAIEKKLEFNKVIKEFGFPTDSYVVARTLKPQCFIKDSEMYKLTEKFENKMEKEIEAEKYDIEHGLQDKDYYKEFESIFKEHSEIFDPELYLLQIGLLLEMDLEIRERIKNFLESKKLGKLKEELIYKLASKDEKSISKIIQLMRTMGFSNKDILSFDKFIKTLPETNVWVPDEKKRNLKTMINKIKNKLSYSDVVLIIDGSETSIKIIDSQTYIGNEKFMQKIYNKNKKRFNEALQEIDLKTEIKKLAPCDFEYVFRYDNLGLELGERLYYSKDEIDKFADKPFVKDPIRNESYLPEELFKSAISNFKCIDFDKLLLAILQAEFDKYGEDVSKFKYEEAVNLKKLAAKIQNLLNRKDIEMNSDRFSNGISFEKLNTAIEMLNNSYVSGVFYSEEQLYSLAEEYITGKKDVQTLTRHEFKDVLMFTDDETLIMLKNDSSILDYLIKADILKDDEKNNKDNDNNLFELLEKQDKISGKQLEILYNNGKLTQSYLLELYMDKDKVGLEEIRYLRENIDEHFEDIVDVSKLVELYLAPDEEKKKFDKYRRLFKEIEIEGKTLEQRNTISDDILGQSIKLLTKESIMELYTLGLLTIDVAIDYTGESSLKKLYLSNELKPIDANRLFYQGIITEDMLKAIMLDKSIDEGRKITLLYSTFPAEEDTEIMRKLEDCLKEVEEDSITESSVNRRNVKRKSYRNGQEVTSEDEIKKLRRKRAYEPRAKYRLIGAIDQDYKLEYNEKDGTAIFYFPSKEEYLIEKLYDKERRPATDVATYILSKDVYEQNEDKIIQDGKVNISELYALKKSNKSSVKRLIHTGWANGIIKYYGLNDEEKYSKNQISEIEQLAKQVEKSKKEVER